MNHKRGRAKNQRAGCLLCKPWKANGSKGQRSMETAAMQRERVTEKEERAYAEDLGLVRYDLWDDNEETEEAKRQD